MADIFDKLKQEELIKEVTYSQNIGFQEMIAFYQQGTDEDIKKMERLVKAKNWIAFKKLIKKVLGVELKG